MNCLGNTRIINIEGSELFYHYLKNEPMIIKNSKDQFDDRFSDIVPPNLDFYYLESQGKFSRKPVGDEYYSLDFVNVSFKYPLFLNEKGEQIFPKKASDVDRKITMSDIRRHLYLNGFVLNGKEYVRYKRSSANVVFLHDGMICNEGSAKELIKVEKLKPIYGDHVCVSAELGYEEISFK